MQCALKDRNNTESDIYANTLDGLIIKKRIKNINETNKAISLTIAGMLLKIYKSPILVLLNLELYNLLCSHQLLTLIEINICNTMPNIVNIQKLIPHIKLSGDVFALASVSIKNIANKQTDTIEKLINETFSNIIFLTFFITSPHLC